MHMVGCWYLELKMVPNDRARLGLGPPGVFGLKIPIFGGHGGPGPLVHRGILAFFRMWPHTNGWAPYLARMPQGPDSTAQTNESSFELLRVCLSGSSVREPLAINTWRRMAAGSVPPLEEQLLVNGLQVARDSAVARFDHQSWT